MRIVFVGIHNKEGLKPLDSKTPSGKRIDAVIENLSGVECIKSNLFDVCYLPKSKEEKSKLAIEWAKKHSLTEEDIVVALGSTVADYLPFHRAQVIYYNHPSPINPRNRFADYISGLLLTIKTLHP